jgi:hypothetical protein
MPDGGPIQTPTSVPVGNGVELSTTSREGGTGDQTLGFPVNMKLTSSVYVEHHTIPSRAGLDVDVEFVGK